MLAERGWLRGRVLLLERWRAMLLPRVDTKRVHSVRVCRKPLHSGQGAARRVSLASGPMRGWTVYGVIVVPERVWAIRSIFLPEFVSFVDGAEADSSVGSLGDCANMRGEAH